MQIKVFGLSDVGMRREKNEDSYLINENLGLFVVADGMGGHVGGEYASKMAVQTIESTVEEIFENPDSPILKENKISHTDYPAHLHCAIRKASHSIHTEASSNPSLRGMGTTAVMMLVKEGRAYLANVGDSRGYLVRGNDITQLTEDHSLVGEQLRAGVITEVDAKEHKLKNIITRSVGFQDEVDIDVIIKVVKEGDRYLLCSDGLTNLVEDNEILEVVRDNPLEEASRVLVDMANARGGDDNITIILVELTGVDEVEAEDEEESTIGI